MHQSLLNPLPESPAKPDQFTSLGIAAACDLHDSELFITDMDAMIDLIHKNVALNGFDNRVKVELLDW